MIALGLIFTALAACIHVYIFYLESLVWTDEKTRKIFGTTLQQAQETKMMAYNQGWYNLFLALLIFAGIAFVVFQQQTIGLTLIVAGAGSMVAAGIVLITSSPDKKVAALKQMIPPLLGLVFIAAYVLGKF